MALFKIRMVAALICAFPMIFPAGLAEARNVPGSAAAGSSQMIEPASNDLIEGVLGGLSGAGTGAPMVGVTTDSSDALLGTGLRFRSGGQGGTFVFGNLNFRTYDLDGEIENGEILTGSLGLGFDLGANTTGILALLSESMTADTPFNMGTLDSGGFGVAAGLQYDVSRRSTLSALIGALWLDYDVTRAGGAVTGTYEAERFFLDLRGISTFDEGPNYTVLSYGLRYLSQDDDAYVETGGGPVAAAGFERVVGFVNGRIIYDMPGALRPYVDADLRLVGYEDSLPAGVLSPVELPGFHAGLGVGMIAEMDGGQFEFGVRANGSSAGYTGYEAHLGLSLRF